MSFLISIALLAKADNVARTVRKTIITEMMKHVFHKRYEGNRF